MPSFATPTYAHLPRLPTSTYNDYLQPTYPLTSFFRHTHLIGYAHPLTIHLPRLPTPTYTTLAPSCTAPTDIHLLIYACLDPLIHLHLYRLMLCPLTGYARLLTLTYGAYL